MQVQFTLTSLYETRLLSRALAEFVVSGDTLLLAGPVGAGKSALARGLIQARMADVGAVEDVPSPTFTLVQTYDLAEVEFWHVDLYRMSSVEELYEIGLEDALGQQVCIIEWPEKLGPLTPKNAMKISLASGADEDRIACLEWTDPRWDTMPDLLDQIGLTKDASS